MSPWALLGGVLLAGAALGGAYWRGRADGANSVIAQQALEERVAAVAGAEAASAAAAAVAGLKVKNSTIIQRQQTEVRRDPVFIDCRSGPAAVQLLNAAAGHPDAASAAGDAGVPAAASAAR